MTMGLIILLTVLFIAALAGTFYAFKQEEKKMKKYEEEGDTVEDQLRRSHEYETSSLKSNVPLQLAIYGVTIVVSLFVFVFYVF
ncbi:hypothetical protein FH966_11220 [Lentibacillus cibarius]|uniref:Uncharacterized protein n=1 Tax=Lentibacillus cibarius TaxID=2583219 RepID=A0A549YJZ4_9BACI|nr:hypothetical protein [Lentibacillus cibarius]TMN23394.1 hypothetical protein FFL34_15795 [Lentibacillus cibarius]TRM12203.1 hypothetical protein FH966_11220 [Lentibacillus cibarius]